MSKVRALFAVAAIAGAVLAGGAAPAQANVVNTSCTAGAIGVNPWYFVGEAGYTVEGANQRWEYAEWTMSGPLLGNKNNLNLRLRHSADGSHSETNTRFSYNSRDGLHPSTAYSTVINTTVPGSENTYVKFNAIFDLPSGIPDVDCNAYTPFV